MPALCLTSPSPVRDLLVTTAEHVIKDAQDSLDGPCADCNPTLTSWCDEHTEDQAVIDDLTPILSRLYETDTDREACAIAGGLLLPGTQRSAA